MIQGSFSTSGTRNGPDVGWADKPALMVRVVSGSPSWVVVLVGSPTGEAGTFTTILTHDSSTNPTGETVFAGAQRFPCLYRNVECVSCSGGVIEVTAWAT